MDERKYSFTKEEKDFIYIQLNGRKMYFQEDMIGAANRKDNTRVGECYKAINLIDDIQRKLLGVQ